MTDLKSAQDMLAAAAAAKTTEDPEIQSIKRLLKLLDKSAKSNRTYGASNPVALKFSQQLYEELSAHLGTYSKLSFLVDRSTLSCKEQIVYQPEQDAGTESLAFKLYADGVRELVLHQGLGQEDLIFFLDSLWGSGDAIDDDDIVTRLWQRNLSSLTIVTAEEVSKATGHDSGFLRLDDSLSKSDLTLRELLDRERGRTGGYAQADGTGGGGAAASPGQRRLQPNVTGYEVTEADMAALAKAIEAERNRDGILYLLDILTAVLASERSPALLGKLFTLYGLIVDALLREGRWTTLETVLSVLQESESIRPDLPHDLKQRVSSLLNGLGQPERLKYVESSLNRSPGASTEGLSTILLLMEPDAIGGLCGLLGNLQLPAHQALVCDTLFSLAKDQPDPILRGLADRRPAYVRNLLALLIRWNNPRFADHIEKLIRHPDAQVRKDVVRAIGMLRPSGNCTKLLSILSDPDETVRFAALKLLASGQYQCPFTLWTTLLNGDEFLERSLAERRALYQAVRATSGDEAVPYWKGLLTDWSWTNRKKKEELAVLAAETLGKLATPAAVETLELGQKKGGSAVRQACTMALSQIHKQQRGRPPLPAAS